MQGAATIPVDGRFGVLKVAAMREMTRVELKRRAPRLVLADPFSSSRRDSIGIQYKEGWAK